MYVNILPESEFVVVNLDDASVTGTNIRVVRVKRGNKVLLDLDEASSNEIVAYAEEKGVKPNVTWRVTSTS